MTAVPAKIKWSQQLTTGEDTEFVVETEALTYTKVIFNPVLRFHNIGDEAADLEIVYTLDLGSATDDPLNSGTYENTVVSETIAAGAFYDYAFGGRQLDDDATINVYHTVTITNTGLTTHVFHTILTGQAEVQAQLAQGSQILKASS